MHIYIGYTLYENYHINSLRTNNITTVKQSTIKPCTYCMGYTNSSPSCSCELYCIMWCCSGNGFAAQLRCRMLVNSEPLGIQGQTVLLTLQLLAWDTFSYFSNTITVWSLYDKMINFFEIADKWYIYWSGHEGVPVLLPGFAIKW